MKQIEKVKNIKYNLESHISFYSILDLFFFAISPLFISFFLNILWFCLFLILISQMYLFKYTIILKTTPLHTIKSLMNSPLG